LNLAKKSWKNLKKGHGMQYRNGEVLTSPNTIFWLQMPQSIGETEKIELLKKDILLVDCYYDLEQINKIKEKKDNSSAYFFNIDALLKKSQITGNEIYKYYSNLARFINSFSPEKSIVHTNIIDQKASELFRGEGLFYLEKNFYDRSIALSTINHLVKPLFVYNNRVPRPFIRLSIYPEIKYKIEIINNSSPKPIISGFLKDLSLNGLGIILNTDTDMKYINLKEQIQLKINVMKSVLKIPVCFITRKDPDRNEIGINYDITDKVMIKEDTSNYLTKIIYNWIKELIDKHGKLG
jgi:hypothetical protein